MSGFRRKNPDGIPLKQWCIRYNDGRFFNDHSFGPSKRPTMFFDEQQAKGQFNAIITNWRSKDQEHSDVVELIEFTLTQTNKIFTIV